MINFNFNLANPFVDRWDVVVSKHGKLFKHKAWEFNTYKSSCIVDVDFRFTTRGDHAGVRLMLGLFGYEAEFNFYDTRHWDYETNTWVTYD